MQIFSHSFFPILVVLLSAMMHASWNALIKSGNDKLVDTALIALFSCVFSIPFLFFVSFPTPETWMFLGISVSIHIVYFFLVAYCYQLGDFSLVYPIMRGVAPVFVVLINLFFIKEFLDFSKNAGIIIICLGLFFLTLSAKKHSKIPFTFKALLFGLLNGVFIALYTVFDGMGVRVQASSMSYSLWMFFLIAFPFIGLTVFLRGKQAMLNGFQNWKKQSFGAVLQILCYVLVLWVMTTQPIALVSALRETSVLFAAIIGCLFLKEPFGLFRTLASIMTILGIIIMRL